MHKKEIKKDIVQAVKSLFISFLVLAGVGLAFADNTFTYPPSGTVPPNNNTPAPLNVSITQQTKAGSLSLNQDSNPWAVGLLVSGESDFNSLSTNPGIVINNTSAGSPSATSFLKWHSGYGPVDGWIKGTDQGGYWESQIHSNQNFGISVGSNVTTDTVLVGSNSVGINTKSPQASLDVTGNIHSTQDVCTDLNGGVCLSTLKGASNSAPTGWINIDQNGTMVNGVATKATSSAYKPWWVTYTDGIDHSPETMCQRAGYHHFMGACNAHYPDDESKLIQGSVLANTTTGVWTVSCMFGSSNSDATFHLKDTAYPYYDQILCGN
jgi:hypothetical protein